MPTLTLPKPHGFRLEAAAAFYASFTPGSGMAAAAAHTDGLTLAFHLDRTFEPTVVSIREEPRALVAEYAGSSDGTGVARQIVRMLGLDANGEAWLEVGRRDPVVGSLQSTFSGFFTAAKASPYDAATWAIIAPRMGMKAAARLKIALAERAGDSVTFGGQDHRLFPGPRALERLSRFPGLPDEKLERLRGIARAALEGRLEAERLRAMPERQALAQLMTLRGVGPWAASHILFRGAAPPDALPTVEPRVLHGFGAAYGIATPTIEQLERAAEAWRPFRMWVCVLLSRHLARSGAWHARGLGRERAAAGRRLVAKASA